MRRILAGIGTNFTGFAPLGTVPLVALLGVGIAERAGLLSAVMPFSGYESSHAK